MPCSFVTPAGSLHLTSKVALPLKTVPDCEFSASYPCTICSSFGIGEACAADELKMWV